MLAAVGAASLDELFDSIPEPFRLNRLLDLPPAAGELELAQRMEQLASKNLGSHNAVCFAGGGAYDHFIPAVVDFVASRSEFYTSYTPYQPEVSQGSLQATFEYQSMICELTGMEAANASLYDGASAAAEAALLCLAAHPDRRQIVAPASLDPAYRAVLHTYFSGVDVELVETPAPNGVADAAAIAKAAPSAAAVLIQQPNFFGCTEDARALAEAVHAAGASVVAVVDPISLGLLPRPGDWGADVVVAEGQSLGVPLSFGGPYLGVMACRDSFVRRLPGRLVGQTSDAGGGRCFVLTLQTREQHIRRDRATSNVCTNQGLLALRAAVYMAAMGPHGLRDAANLCLQKAAYTKSQIAAQDGLEVVYDRPTFKEFAVRSPGVEAGRLIDAAAERGMLVGPALGGQDPNAFLVAVTEQRTREQIDSLAATLGAIVQESLIHA